jgi:hypothetical protein
MAWSEIARETTVAPRNLTRAKRPNVDAYPSVGGTVSISHVTWRCSACRKLAVTRDSKPGKCCCGAAP